ncbi:MAG: SHOCT domain-containing protein [Desulfobacteraceae bacterium]|nr:SHOCT domain-containing protein [Desulfobacteraceae bacterium]
MKIIQITQLPFIFGFLLFLSLWGCTRSPMGQTGPYRGHMMDYGYGGIFMWLILLALVVFLIYIFLIQPKKSGDSGGGQPEETPLDILKKRYARGDITKEEFENLKRDIEK